MAEQVAIVITYQPDPTLVAEVLRAVAPQVDRLLVVDNASDAARVRAVECALPANGQLIRRASNEGVAVAINAGLRIARQLRARYAIIFDQDSVPERDMVADLMAAMRQKQREHIPVAAVGPRFVDALGQLDPAFVRLSGCKLERIPCRDGVMPLVDHLISSGCLIDMAALQVIGDMDERLFIDYVDTEWCLRARSAGYHLYGVPGAVMRHNLGDGRATLFGRTVPVHSALRNYYKLRNGVWLLRQPWVTNGWRIADGRRLLMIYIACSLFIGQRFENWKMMTRGIWHGVADRMGKIDY